MPLFDASSIKKIAIHYVGNKSTDEGYVLSNQLIPITDQLQDILIRYLISPFKGDAFYHFYHEDGVERNEVFQRVSNIFDNAECILDESASLAQLLYNATEHPNLNGGDFVVVYFDECQLNGETTSAVGLFKSEHTESFLKVAYSDEQFSSDYGEASGKAKVALTVDRGIATDKLDKGVLIFNQEREQGYILSLVESSSRSLDSTYWRDAFLQVCQRKDQYYNTHTEMQALKQFVTDELPQQFEGVSRADQADMLNRSVSYFKSNDSFSVEEFAREVIAQPEVIESFQNFRERYQQDNDIVMQDEFAIDDDAVKRQSRSFKSVIKLDKNFHIYVHGDRDLIEQGEDERGKFYKVYYNQES